MIKRVFVEHKDGAQAQSLMRDIKANLKLENLSGMRVLQRYDAEGIDDDDYAKLKYTIFCEAPVENLYEETFPMAEDETAFGVEYPEGGQRAPMRANRAFEKRKFCLRKDICFKRRIGGRRRFKGQGLFDKRRRQPRSLFGKARDIG